MGKFFRLASLTLASFALPTLTLAHEVYVLDEATVAAGLATSSPNPFSAYTGNEYEFFFWGLVSFIVLSTVLFATLFHAFEHSLWPLFSYLKRFAQPLVRITVGLCLLSFGLAGELYGTEIDFEELFGPLSVVLQGLFIVSGAATILGIYTRTIAVLSIAAYAYSALILGPYVLTYTDHLGGYMLLLILGAGSWSLENLLHRGYLRPSVRSRLQVFVPFAFPVMRMLFGFGVMFAAVYAKFIHSELALNVVTQYHLTDYFPFEPLFIVLGALIVEFLAGLMIFFGVAVRWTGLFLIFWLTLSLLYFQEAVWPHIILLGLGLAIFCHGYDRYSLEGRFFKKHGAEPVL